MSYLESVLNKIDDFIEQGEFEFYEYNVYHCVYKKENDDWGELGNIALATQLDRYLDIHKITRITVCSNECDILCDDVDYRIKCKPDFLSKYGQF